VGDVPPQRPACVGGQRVAAAAGGGLLLEASYQRERRQLAARRKAAFAVEPTAPNQVWQLDFTEFETTSGGTWRLAGCRDYWSKYEASSPTTAARSGRSGSRPSSPPTPNYGTSAPASVHPGRTAPGSAGSAR
jgi:hypothetical protein